MQKLKRQVIKGWPQNKREVAEEIKEFHKMKDEIFVIDNLLFRNNALIIPNGLKNTVLKLLHEGHPGIVRAKRRARNFIYWPGMSRDIENFIENCSICQEYSKSNYKQTLIQHLIPEFPWKCVGTDIFEIDSNIYLLIVDYFSKFIEIIKLSSYNSTTVIGHLKSIFARFGILAKLISDNDPPYSSQEFKNCTLSWDIDHGTSSPYYPKSNGLAERSIQTIKDIFRKTIKENKDINLALLEYRSAPLESGYSPSQLLMCRNLRTLLPTSVSLSKPNLPDYKKHYEQVKNTMQKTKSRYDLTAKVLSELNVEDVILFQKKPNSNWLEGTVISGCKQSRSCVIRDKNDIHYRRNRIHLKLIHKRSSSENITGSQSSRNNVLSIETDINNEVHDKVSTDYVTKCGRVVKPPERLQIT